MPSENLIVAKIVSVLSWIVLGLGVVGIAVFLWFQPIYNWNSAIPYAIALGCVLFVFVVLHLLARILRTLTYLYQLSWEQFQELGNDIDELDGVNDGNVKPLCPACGAILPENAETCARCGKKVALDPEKQKEQGDTAEA